MSDVDQAVNDLRVLSGRTPEVKMMINLITDAEDMDLFDLAEAKPEVFWEFYESCYTMIAELGEDFEI